MSEQVVTDDGSQFTAAKLKDLVRRFAAEHIRIRTYPPESNGVRGRYHRSTRKALGEEAGQNLSQARAIIARWVRYQRGAGARGVTLPPA